MKKNSRIPVLARRSSERRSLSLLERRVLAHVADGAGEPAIAARLSITVASLRRALQRIATKTGARGHARLTRLAVSLGLAGPL